jgi:CysZ protein
MSILRAAAVAAADILSKPFRQVLWTSLGLTMALFGALFLAIEFALTYLDLARFEWLGPAVAILTGLGLLTAFVFLAAPVTALFAGLFLDRIAALVEAVHYPYDPPGKPLPAIQALSTGLRFGSVVLIANLLALPFLLFGIGALVMFIANTFLLGREYFELASLRHLPRSEAAKLRQKHAHRIFLAGLLPAALVWMPFANLLVPIFSTAYFMHLFKSLMPGKAPESSVDKGKGRG